MRIDPAGWPIIGGGAVLALIGAWPFGPLWAIPGVVIILIGLFFFRDPERVSPASPDVVLSPADGRVMVAGAPTQESTPAGAWQQISIFLSPLDVHVNRIPASGTVTRVEYHPGRFLPAYKREAGDLNEYTEIWLDHGPQTLVVRQIVGLLARRVVCRTAVGATVVAGQRYGVMKFGSRMDVFLPADATLHVKPGDRVTAGVTVMAELAARGTR